MRYFRNSIGVLYPGSAFANPTDPAVLAYWTPVEVPEVREIPKPKFKAGDVVRWKSNGNKRRIVGVRDDIYEVTTTYSPRVWVETVESVDAGCELAPSLEDVIERAFGWPSARTASIAAAIRAAFPEIAGEGGAVAP